MYRAVLWGCTAAFIWSLPSFADNVSRCAPPSGVVSVQIPQHLPRSLQKSLGDSVGEIALPGQNFQSTDVVTGGPVNRFIFVWHASDKWLVALERGGFVYNNPILLYQINNDRPRLLRSEVAYPPTVCSAATRLIMQ